MIIGVGHKARNGKSTIVEYLRLKYDFVVLNFADALYEECRNAYKHLYIGEFDHALWPTSVDDRNVLYAETGNAYIEFPESLNGISHLFDSGMTEKCAPFLQWWGTEYRRKYFGEDYWIKKVASKIDEDCGRSDFAIGDMRFKNEASFIKDYGGITMKVFRDETEDIGRDPNHPSEIDLDNWEFDHIIENNSTKGDLFRKVDDIMVRLGDRYEKLA